MPRAAQAQRAFVLAFTTRPSPRTNSASQQLLTGLDLRATGLTTRIAAPVRDAGTRGTAPEDHARVLRTEAEVSGITAARLTLELALAFHHAVLDDRHRLNADRPSRARWIDGEAATRARWHTLVVDRRACLGGG
ncbi:hypothetical protein ACIBU0_12585 [Streptomyces sp. NPDC049627]|uniref:hypothetical protein n=1 Tax=Streptomyces sp. NPDC049627 TaxID=3365595 RepID=UPI0037A39C96